MGFDLGDFLRRLFGSRNERVIKGILPIVQAVNEREPEFERLSDDALRAKTAVFRERLRQGAAIEPVHAAGMALLMAGIFCMSW